MELSRDEARRIGLAAQGFAEPRPKRVTAATLARTIRRMAVLQLDFVNVLLPAHYLMLYSRLGPYRRELLDELIYVRHEFTESYAREAAVIPVETWPLFEQRRAAHLTSRPSFKPFLESNQAYVQGVLRRVKGRGPLLASDVPDPKGKSGGLVGSYPHAALEHLFGRGKLAVATRAMAGTAKSVVTVDIDPWVTDPEIDNVVFTRARPLHFPGAFQLAFIDGSHQKAEVLEDIAYCLQIRTIAMHDTYLDEVREAIEESPLKELRVYDTRCRLALFTAS